MNVKTRRRIRDEELIIVVTIILMQLLLLSDQVTSEQYEDQLTPWQAIRSGSMTSSALISESSGPPLNTEFPQFTESSIANVTVFQGREATLTCSVKDLGNYRVAWLRAEPDIGTLLSVHTTVIANDARLKVSHNGHHKWSLHLKDVAESDTGLYMCQINTEPMMSQTGYLDVLVAPTIVEDETSSDTVVDERGKVSLRCKARGYPSPTVTWRREDGRELNLGSYGGKKTSGAKYEGEFLNISQVSRDDMGAYLCIISNSVPPSVTKRISLQVNFKPKIRVATQVVGSPIGSDATLECRIESSPKPLISWMRSSDQMILLSNSKYQLTEEFAGGYKVRSRIRIINVTDRDYGSYKCVAKNTLGEKEGFLRLFETKAVKSKENTEATTVVNKSSSQSVSSNNNRKSGAIYTSGSGGGSSDEDVVDTRNSKRYKNSHYSSESDDYNYDGSVNYNHDNYTLFLGNNNYNSNVHRIRNPFRRNCSNHYFMPSYTLMIIYTFYIIYSFKSII